MDLIKQIHNSTKQKNKLEQAYENAVKELGLSENMDFDPTALDDDQIDRLVDYMADLINDASKRGVKMLPQDAAGMALEDVAGFEDPDAVRSMIRTLVRRFAAKFRGAS